MKKPESFTVFKIQKKIEGVEYINCLFNVHVRNQNAEALCIRCTYALPVIFGDHFKPDTY